MYDRNLTLGFACTEEPEVKLTLHCKRTIMPCKNTKRKVKTTYKFLFFLLILKQQENVKFPFQT